MIGDFDWVDYLGVLFVLVNIMLENDMILVVLKVSDLIFLMFLRLLSVLVKMVGFWRVVDRIFVFCDIFVLVFICWMLMSVFDVFISRLVCVRFLFVLG